jgi:AcrR family transcriptional regulator
MAAQTTRRRRDASADDTRRAITIAAIELVQELGWRAATIERIAERAGVAKGTFFVHFPNKEALIETLVGMQVAAARRAGEKTDLASPVARLRETVLTLGRHAGASIELSRAVLVATLQSPDLARSVDAMFEGVYERMIADAREAIAQGLLAGTEAEPLAGLLMASYLGAALHCTTSPRARPFDEVLSPLVDATLAAFATDIKTTTKRRKTT